MYKVIKIFILTITLCVVVLSNNDQQLNDAELQEIQKAVFQQIWEKAKHIEDYNSYKVEARNFDYVNGSPWNLSADVVTLRKCIGIPIRK